MNSTFACHSILRKNIFGFDPDDYSRFKFGDASAAAKFGKELAENFIRSYHKTLLENKQWVVLPSPYTAIPTASYVMTEHFIRILNRYLCEKGMKALEVSKIHRYKTYSVDYGELNAEDRLGLILNDKYSLDKNFLADKNLIFVDDIKITGSHELVIKNLLKKNGLTNDSFFLYFAELKSNEIHPNIENYLNYHFVKSLNEITEIIESGNFRFNTRVVKYILLADFISFEKFILQSSNDFRNELTDLAISNSYPEMPEYRRNFNYLINLVSQKQTIWQ
jgi:hypothetical protein